MNPSKTDLPWSELKARLQQKYAQLTDDDLSFVEGKGEELLLRLQRKLGLNRDEAARAVSDLETGANQAAAAGRKVAEDVRDRVSDTTEALRQRARAGYDDARSYGQDLYAHGRERVRTFEHEVEDYVREKPLTSVGIALAAGFVLGWAIRH